MQILVRSLQKKSIYICLLVHCICTYRPYISDTGDFKLQLTDSSLSVTIVVGEKLITHTYLKPTFIGDHLI